MLPTVQRQTAITRYLVFPFSYTHLPLGDMASFDVGGMICTPLITLLLYRKCVDIEDFGGLLLASAGVICITHPTIIFGVDLNAPPVPPLA